MHMLSKAASPAARSAGRRLMGFLIVNEGYSMVRKEDSVLTRTSDVTISLTELQRFINLVAGRIRRRMPGALLASSLKLRVNSRWNERTGVKGIGVWYSDEALISAGGDPDGTLDIRQYQYYPENAYGPEDSPFINSESMLRVLHHQTKPKPAVAGEFPLIGLVAATHNPTPMSLREGYEALWKVRVRVRGRGAG